MAETAIHENGISMKLCEICNSNTTFCTEFCQLFPNFPKQKNNAKKIKEIEYMWFSGNLETHFGKPDITFRFTDGDFFFIEVKTKCSTGVQGNQELGFKDKKTKEKLGYIGLIEYLGQDVNKSYAFLVDQGHPGFDTIEKEIGENGEYIVPVVTWTSVINLLKKIKKDKLERKTQLDFFMDELKNNVDGLENNESINFSSGELMFLKSPQRMVDYEEKLIPLYDLNLTENQSTILFTHKLSQSSEVGNDNISNYEPSVNFKLSLNCHATDEYIPNWGFLVSITKDVETLNNQKVTKSIMFDKSIFIGFNPSLCYENNVIDKSNSHAINDCMFAIAIYSDLLDTNKIRHPDENLLKICQDNLLINNNKIEFCKDSDCWYYFPLADLLEGEEFSIDILNKLFKKEIRSRVEFIFKNFLPSDTRRINNKSKEIKNE